MTTTSSLSQSPPTSSPDTRERIADRLCAPARWLSFPFWIAVLYCSVELLLWALTFVLSRVRLPFFSAIFGMVITYILMLVGARFHPGTERFYSVFLKEKVDFINVNLGAGFPVPIIMIGKEALLEGSAIGKIIGNFVITNAVLWFLTFALTWTAIRIIQAYQTQGARSLRTIGTPYDRWLQAHWGGRSPGHFGRASEGSASTTVNGNSIGMESRPISGTTVMSDVPPPRQPETCRQGGIVVPDGEIQLQQEPHAPIGDAETNDSLPPEGGPAPEPVQNLTTDLIKRFLPFRWITISLSFLLIIGIPVTVMQHDDRILDGGALWFVWITTITVQRTFKSSTILLNAPKLCNAITTLLNPVLWTTLGMTGYVRAKTRIQGVPLAAALENFSSGTSLAEMWTLGVGGTLKGGNGVRWFGAGDAALSLLECGVVAWGFKLYECHRQLWSVAGLAVMLMSIVASLLSVFLPVLLGKAVGLAAPEVLAFAARSTTLALAKPAMKALGGNQVVNAAVVVSNGILGQLMYPYILDKLRVPDEDEDKSDSDSESADDVGKHRTETTLDSATIIAIGTAIGINGAAMGVAYLCERKSRAAPYAALAMTSFGGATICFTTLAPFTETLIRLAR